MVRHACRKIEEELDKMRVEYHSMANASGTTTNAHRTSCSNFLIVKNKFEKCFDDYLGRNYSDYWYFKVAEFLDPRTHLSILPDQLKTIINQMKPMCLKAELQVASSTNNRSAVELSDREKIRQSLLTW
jgi:hypothetical protein